MRITCIGMHQSYIRGLMMMDDVIVSIIEHSLLLVCKLCVLAALTIGLVIALPFALYDWMRGER